MITMTNSITYDQIYNFAYENPEDFWKKEGERIDWIKPYKKIRDVVWSKKDVRIKWFYDGTLNASYNCIDRHLEKDGDKIAIIWEGDNPNESLNISYKELHKNVSKFANILKSWRTKRR